MNVATWNVVRLASRAIGTLATLAVIVLANGEAQGQYTYVPTTGVTGNWLDPNRWTGGPAGTVPNGVDASATLNLPLSTDLATNQTATAFDLQFTGATVTLGSLTINSANTDYQTQISSGTSLVFEHSSGTATYTENAGTSTAGRFNITVPVQLNSDLYITQNNAPSLNTGSIFANRITGAANRLITKDGAASIQLNDNNTLLAGEGFLGNYLIKQGGIRTIGKAGLMNSSGVTVNAGGQLQLAEGNSTPVPDYSLGAGATLTLNGTGKASGATTDGALRFGLGTNGTAMNFNSKVLLASDSRIVNPTNGKTARLTAEVRGSGRLIKGGDGALVLQAHNIYTGGTTVAAGALILDGADASLGSGNVTVNTGSLRSLTINSNVLDAFSDNAVISLAGGIDNNTADQGFLDLGINETVRGLIVGLSGSQINMAPGVYGSTASGAPNILDEYFRGTGKLTVIDADFDDSLAIDSTDYSAWETNFGGAGQTHAAGDSNGDADVDGGDFLAWQRQFGLPGGAAVSAATAAPEPSAALLLVLSAPLASMIRRKR